MVDFKTQLMQLVKVITSKSAAIIPPCFPSGTMDQRCQRHWYLNFLYINNLIHFGQENVSMYRTVKQ